VLIEKNLVFFMKNYVDSIKNKKIFTKSFAPVISRKLDYLPEANLDNRIEINGKNS